MTAATARLLIVGPQGSGKGTQGIRIADTFGVPAISTGDIFRAAIANETPLGKEVKSIIDAGNLVPDELTSAIVAERVSEADAAGGFLLDGYPRNISQVHDLDAHLQKSGDSVTAVIELHVERSESIARLTARATEQGRADDNEAAIANRLAIYERETAPILDVYRERGIVDTIDGTGSLDEVFDRILAALGARGLAPVAAA